MPEARLWSLDVREYDALVRVRQELRKEERMHQVAMLAQLRADLHNTSARMFDRVFDPEEFMPGHQQRIEDEILDLVATGKYTASQAAAIVTARKSKGQQLQVIRGMRGAKKGRRAG